MIPKHINEQMWEVLDQISDETGELRFDEYWLLRYEGWSSACFDRRFKYEESMRAYALGQSPKIHKEWNAEMTKRRYKVAIIGHDVHLGLYGVTYALYQRRPK